MSRSPVENHRRFQIPLLQLEVELLAAYFLAWGAVESIPENLNSVFSLRSFYLYCLFLVAVLMVVPDALDALDALRLNVKNQNHATELWFALQVPKKVFAAGLTQSPLSSQLTAHQSLKGPSVQYATAELVVSVLDGSNRDLARSGVIMIETPELDLVVD